MALPGKKQHTYDEAGHLTDGKRIHSSALDDTVIKDLNIPPLSWQYAAMVICFIVIAYIYVKIIFPEFIA